MLLLFVSMLVCSTLYADIAVKSSPGALLTEKTAVKELNRYLGQVLGKSQNITVDGDIITEICVGDGAWCREAGIDVKALKNEEYVIKSSGSRIIIAGGGNRGTLLGAASFLENQIGVMWLTAQTEYVPPKQDIVLEKLDIKARPFFERRSIYRTNDWSNIRFLVMNRANSSGGYVIPAEYGGECRAGSPRASHTFEDYFPFRQYKKSNPEYFSLINGKRVGGQLNGQLCLTNMNMRKTFLQKLFAYIEKDRREAAAKGIDAPFFYDVSQNDNWNYCRCRNCSKMAAQYGQSGVMVDFVNYLARAIAPKYPEIKLSTFAYFYTEPLPLGGIKPEKNVIIQLCDTKSNQALGIYAAGSEKYRQKLEDWSKISNNLYIWFYAITFSKSGSGLPFPSEYTHGEVWRFYADNKVKGIFIEHERPHRADMYALKVWLELKLMENPYADTEMLISKFCNAYYGKAAGHIIEARKLLYAAAKRNKAFVDSSGMLEQFKYIDADTMLAMQKAFDDATAAAAGNHELLLRVNAARRGVDMLTVRFSKEYAGEYFKKNPSAKSFPLDMNDIIKRFEDSWMKSCEPYFKWNKNSTIGEINKEIAMARNSSFRSYVPPKKFAGKKYIDFSADKLSFVNGNGMSYCEDSESDNGLVIRAVMKDHPKGYWNLPFSGGIYNSPTGTHHLGWNLYEIKRDGKYHWYYAGQAAKPSGNIYLTRAWTVRADLTSQLDQMRSLPACDMWVKLKFTGPSLSNSGDTDMFFIDRVVLVHASEKTAPPPKKVSADVAEIAVFAKFDGQAHTAYPAARWIVSPNVKELRKLDDPLIPGGKVVRVALTGANAGKFRLPFGIGVYDNKTQKMQLPGNIRKVKTDGKYHWYKIGDVSNPTGMVYMTNTWGVNMNISQEPGDYELWACLKFTGRDFVPGSTEPGNIYMAQVVFKQK